MPKTSVFASLFDDGLTSVNFFNGRLLSAEDLKTESRANHDTQRRLGRSIGDGVIAGLVVREASGSTAAAPIVTVTAGLAIDRRGNPIRLAADTDVSLLTNSATPPATITVETFDYCTPPVAGTYHAGDGVYILTIGRTRGTSGLAPVSGLGNQLAGCSAKSIVEGVRFALVPVTADAEIQDPSHLRNLIAYRLLGIATLQTFAAAPFGSDSDYGDLAALRDPKSFSDSDVPLAVIYWTTDGLQFVDTWAVRRRPVPLLKPSTPWRTIAASRRLAEAEATLWQFQEHLTDLFTDESTLPTLKITDAFRYLPAAGLAPIRNTAFPRGVVVNKFFDGVSFGDAKPIDAARVRPLLIESLAHEPVDLSSGRRLQLYAVAENQSAQSGSAPPQPFVIFTSDYLPYVSTTPRFGDLCATVRATVSAYRALARRGAFLRAETTGTGVAARLEIEASIRDVAEVAGDNVRIACFGGISAETALQLLKDLYDIQKDLVTVLTATWTGVTDLAAVNLFAPVVQNYLDVSGDNGAIPLSTALAQKNLVRATAAQGELAAAVASWSSTAMTGNLDVVYKKSTRGRTLVQNDQNPFLYVFNVTNRTNRTLDAVQLAAGFDAPKAAWNPSVSVLDANGAALARLSLKPFDSSNPQDPKASTDVFVSIMTPTDTLGAIGKLRLQATSAAPNTAGDSDTVDLTIGSAEVADVDHIDVAITNVQGKPGDATTGVTVTYSFHATFSSPLTPPTASVSAKYKVVYSIAAADAGLFVVDLQNHDPNVTTTTAGGMTKVVQVTPSTSFANGQQQPTMTLKITGGNGSLNKSITVALTVESDDGTIVGTPQGSPFTVAIKH